MNKYEQKMVRQMLAWQRRVKRNPSFASKMARSAQGKINEMIPEKVHKAVTSAIKQMVRGVLLGAGYTVPKIPYSLSWEDREKMVQDKIDFYKKAAAAEGGITGMGGLLLGLADFPILLSLKLKLLYDIATIYGYDVKDFKERMYLLYIFQLAFSSQHHRQNTFRQIEHWKERQEEIPGDIHDVDWRTFQQEYRDHIDLAKMAQLIPVVGAVVGFVVNYNLIVKLGEYAMNAYRMRLMEDNPSVMKAYIEMK
jgi:hypothetical protein